MAVGIGSNDIGLDRGQLGNTRIVEFRRVGSKVLLVQPNYSYRANSDNTDEVKAVEQAFAESVLFGFKIEAESDAKLLIDLSPMLMSTCTVLHKGSLEIDKVIIEWMLRDRPFTLQC